VVRALKNDKALYFVKIDFKKYFEHIVKEILMQKLEARIKDPQLLELCRRIIFEYDGDGLPIGNYTSQYWANFYLSELDHHMKERMHCTWYFRYMDDIVIIGWDKGYLHRCLTEIRKMTEPWGLEIKGNWCIRPTSDGIDFVGFVMIRHGPGDVQVKLRKRTKIRMKRASDRIRRKLDIGEPIDKHDLGVLASYYGCLKWCNGHYLGKKTIYPLMLAAGIRTEEELYHGMHEIDEHGTAAGKGHRSDGRGPLQERGGEDEDGRGVGREGDVLRV